MITRIEAYRYRCFDKVAVDLGPYQVIAGPNGAGKTTLLDIPLLLGDLTVGQRSVGDVFLRRIPSRAVARAQSFAELIYQGRGDDFVLVVEVAIPEEIGRKVAEFAPERDEPPFIPSHLRYELRFQTPDGMQLHVVNEYLFAFEEGPKRPTLGGGLQGEPMVRPRVTKHPRRLREAGWRSLIHREKGDPLVLRSEMPSVRRGWEFAVPPEQVGLANVPADRSKFPIVCWFRDLLQQETIFYDLNLADLRSASPPGQPTRLIPSGANLAWLVLGLQKEDPERIEDWVDHVRTALPQVQAIRAVVREGDFHAYLVVTYRGGHEVPSFGLSDGTLRILALTIVPYLPSPPRLLITEEPENGVHPRAVAAILESLRSLYEGQVLISTHSPVVVAHTELRQVLCARMDQDGAVEIIPGPNHPRFKDWKGGIDLGTLFAAGVLG